MDYWIFFPLGRQREIDREPKYSGVQKSDVTTLKNWTKTEGFDNFEIYIAKTVNILNIEDFPQA